MENGDTLGRWRLVERLGQGFNGEVWRCTGPSVPEAAVKVLLEKHDAERLARFRNEIGFLLRQERRHGVVPILDHDLSGPDQVWYVMPLAIPMPTALGPDPAPERVIEAVAAIAGTLAELAEEGISHRDLKPDNLFRLDGVWAIGDFGLVKYPEGEPLTVHGRKVGAYDFMAPEMRESPDTADARLADVHALAKTLWVLLADQNFPLPGPHRADDDAYRLTARLRHRWAAQLDRLIERCTDHDPARRLSLREMADELTAMLTPTAEAAMPDVDDLERRLAMMAEPRRRQDERRDSFRAQLTGAWDRIVAEVAVPAYEALAARLPHFERRYDSNVGGPRALIHIPSIQIGDDGWGSSTLAPGGGRARVDLGVAMRVRDHTGRIVVGALLEVHRHNGGLGRSEEILGKLYETTVDSARFEATLAEVSAAFAQRLPEALRVLLAAMEAEDGVA